MKIINDLINKVKSAFKGKEQHEVELHPEEPGYGALRIQPQEDDEEDEKLHSTMEPIDHRDV